MSVVLVILCLTLLTSLMAMHIYNENSLSKRIAKAGFIVQQLLDHNGINHIDFDKKFETSTLTTQIRVIEYYLNYLDSNYKDFGTKKSVFQRIANIESVLTDSYEVNQELSLT